MKENKWNIYLRIFSIGNLRLYDNQLSPQHSVWELTRIVILYSCIFSAIFTPGWDFFITLLYSVGLYNYLTEFLDIFTSLFSEFTGDKLVNN